MNILINLLQYAPGHSGFSSYAKRVIPSIPGDRIYLSSNKFSPLIEPNDDSLFPESLPCNHFARISHRLGIVSEVLSATGSFPRRIRDGEGYSIVYSPFSYSLSGSCGLPEVLTCHDLIPLYFPGSLKSKLKFKLVVDSSLRRASKIIAISQFCADQLVDSGYDARSIEVILNGVSIDRPRVESCASQDILVISRHDANKNLQLALQGVSRLLQKFPGWLGRLIIVGRTGRCSSSLRRYISEWHIKERVLFVESIGQEELVRLLRRSLCLVSPSLMEGFNFPVLESMAEGIPCLISDIQVHQEIYSGSSLFFDPRYGAERLADHIITLCRDQQTWSELSNSGYRLANKLQVSNQVQSILSVLEMIRT